VIEHIETGIVAAAFVARYLVGGDADAAGDLCLREVASLPDTAKPSGADGPRPICGCGTHVTPILS